MTTRTDARTQDTHVADKTGEGLSSVCTRRLPCCTRRARRRSWTTLAACLSTEDLQRKGLLTRTNTDRGGESSGERTPLGMGPLGGGRPWKDALGALVLRKPRASHHGRFTPREATKK
eukprot:scaffold3711_cov163-Isochrysis_galbana.AAC.3